MPPKSQGKEFSPWLVFQKVKQFYRREIPTWTEMVIQLGVDEPDVSKGESSQKLTQYGVRLKAGSLIGVAEAHADGHRNGFNHTMSNPSSNTSWALTMNTGPISQQILIRQELLFVMASTLKMTWRFGVCCPISDPREAARGLETTRCQLPCPRGPSPLLPRGSPLAEHLFPHIQETRLALGIRCWHQMMGHTRPCRGIRTRLSHLPREAASGTHPRLLKEGAPRASLRLGGSQGRTMGKQEADRLWRGLLSRDLVPPFQNGPGLSPRLPLGRSKTLKQQDLRHQLEPQLLR